MDGREADNLANALIHAAGILAKTNEEIAQSASAVQAESNKIQRRLFWLTIALAAGAFFQAIAIGWPYIAWFFGHP